MDSTPVRLTAKENFLQTAKYCCVAASAGAVQIGSFALLSELIFHDKEGDYGPSYFIALVLSVLWNFTFNRKFTFKSANNIPVAMLKVAGYYLVFTPLSTWWGVALDARWPRYKYLILFGTMFVNGVTEFLFQRFVVFRGSINTSESGRKAEAKKHDQSP